jgi:hypothetical protein
MLLLHFTQHREKGAQITGPLPQRKALVSYKKFNKGGFDFTASADRISDLKKIMECGSATSTEKLILL